MVDDVSVQFGANTAGVETGGQTVKGVVASIGAGVQGLIDLMVELGGASTGSFRQMGTAAHEAGEQVKGAAEGVSAMREAISGIGEALIAAFAIHEIADFAKGMAETAEQVAHTATTFGLVSGQVQQLKALAAGAGVPFEALTTAMQRSDRALITAREGSKQATEAFKTLGINIHEPIDQASLLQREIAGLANVQDVPTRIGLAMQLFGRNIQNIGPIIGLTKDQLDAINQSMTDYGVVSDDAEQKGLALAEAFNTNHIAMQGLGNVMAESLAPVLTTVVDGVNQLIKGFIQSYNQGGAAKTIMDLLVVSLRALVTAAAALGIGIVVAIDVVKGAFAAARDAWDVFVDEFEGKAKETEDGVVALGKVIYDSLTHNILAAANDMKAGWATIQADAAATARAIAQDAAQMRAAFAGGGGNEAGAAMGGATSFLERLWGPGGKLPGLPKGGGGAGSVPDLGGGRHKGGGDQMEEYRTKLAQLEDQTRASTGQWLADLSQMDLDYWNGILEHAKLSKKEREEVERTIADLTRKINGEKQTDLLAADKAQIDADKGNLAAMKADWQKYVDDTVAAYGAGARQVIRAKQEMADALRAETKREVDGEVADILEGLKKEEEAQKQSWERQVAAAKKAAEEFKRAWDHSIGAITQEFAQGLLKMAEGTESFGQLMRNIGQKILTDWVNNIAKMVSNWARGIAAQTLATQVGETAKIAAKEKGASQALAIDGIAQIKEIVNSAATAAGKAYQAMAGIPVIGPELGAVAAAATFAAVIAFRGLIASAAGGYDIPAGVNPMTQLHAQEMVLPARLANPMRDMLAGGGSGGPWGAPSIDMSGHSYTINGGGTPSDMRQALADHRHELAKQVYQAVREGSRAPRGLSSPFAA